MFTIETKFMQASQRIKVIHRNFGGTIEKKFYPYNYCSQKNAHERAVTEFLKAKKLSKNFVWKYVYATNIAGDGITAIVMAHHINDAQNITNIVIVQSDESAA